MTEHAITTGQFIGLSTLATGDVRLKIDIPREHALEAMMIFGDAVGAQVSVARLNDTATVPPQDVGYSSPPSKLHALADALRQKAADEDAAREPIPTTAPGRPRTPWHELTRTQQSGIRCDEERFKEFLDAHHRAKMQAVERDPAEFVRQHCGVSTRAHLDTDSIAAAMWEALDLKFRTWAGLEAEPR